ncbi:MAG TPA: hypothetical protein VFR81_02035 [Longimicrobium sp.]|nr:hypothetical protein [Longimicrobium sp.]
MKKLTLQLESLQVQSFDTGARAAPRGTVRANDYTEQNDEMANTDKPSRWFFDCITLTCICGASEKELCSAGCPG